MIEERAQVIDIKGESLVLQAQRQSACGSCAASKGCGTSVLSRVVGQKISRFQADNNINARVGDTVIVAIPEGALVKASLIIYLVPVVAMIIAGLLADVMFEAAQPYREFAIAMSSIAGLVCGSLLAKRYFVAHGRDHRYNPVVLRKIID